MHVIKIRPFLYSAVIHAFRGFGIICIRTHHDLLNDRLNFIIVFIQKRKRPSRAEFTPLMDALRGKTVKNAYIFYDAARGPIHRCLFAQNVETKRMKKTICGHVRDSHTSEFVGTRKRYGVLFLFNLGLKVEKIYSYIEFIIYRLKK